MSQTAAVVVAAGRGIRVGGGTPKQYRRVAGKAVLTRTLAALAAHPDLARIQPVIAADAAAFYGECLADLPEAVRARIAAPVEGGATRQISVRAGLEALARAGAPDHVLVHDAARPFVDRALIDRAIAAARAHRAAVPGVGVSDTIKIVDPDGRVRQTPPRDSLRAVQTPQAFAFAALVEAHRAAAAEGLDAFTDDGALAEWAGLPVFVFEGDLRNRKITQATDLDEADRAFTAPAFAADAASLPSPAPDGDAMTLLTRLGTGFDVHAFTEGDHVWLGGVRIPADRGVLAHSDGDVVLHALTDAILGALADGDIGVHFPPSDPRWRGASSDQFLADAVRRVRERGGVIDHLDVTVLAEAPRVGAHREAIRARIAEVAGVPVSAVSIKATTTEQLGFVGRAEGLAAQAAATLRLPAGEAPPAGAAPAGAAA
ncbi:MAG: bifunctional 2-C-methyl-D-erythritol 4-phosphate cytidylyltransferase/2-C-methyl-D-erythritol 2,4-cyclodiphosphate synthase [Methylobacterium frigidaeris]